jgi:hypothetical protein
LGELDDGTLIAALKDPHTGVRENAVKLNIEREAKRRAKRTLVAASPKDLVAHPERFDREWILDDPPQQFLALANDESPRVRFQVAFALGFTSSERAA